MYHPECGKSEIFVGNTRTDGELRHLDGVVQYRIGSQAYDIHGAKLDQGYMRPLFIASDSFDAYDRIMVARGKNEKI